MEDADNADFEFFKATLETHRIELKDIIGHDVIFNPRFNWKRFITVKKECGYFGCPCKPTRPPCPCPDHVNELLEEGSCYCGLFKSDSFCATDKKTKE